MFDFTKFNQVFTGKFGVPCQLVSPSQPVGQSEGGDSAPPVTFNGIYYSPTNVQTITLTPQRTLAISSERPTLWVDLDDLPAGVAQDQTVIIDPGGVTPGVNGPLTRKVHDIQPDGQNGCFLVLKKTA